METLTVRTKDGVVLGATAFDATRPGPALVISPAMAVRASFYTAFASRMAAEGIATLTYDYRGIGASRSGSLRGVRADMTDWATRDMPAALAAARARWPERRLVMMGHSAGGWMAALCQEAAQLDAFVTVAAQDGHWRHWRGLARLRLWVIWHVAIPAASRAFGHLPGNLGLGQDVPARAARQWAAYARRRDFIASEADFTRLAMPVLSLRIADDDYAPAAAVDALHARFPQARLTRRVIEPREVGKPIGHFGLFREDVGGPLWSGIASQIRALAMDPSSAPAAPGAAPSR